MNDEEKKKGVMTTVGMILIVIFAFWVIVWDIPILPDKVAEVIYPESAPEPTPEVTPIPTPENDTQKVTSGWQEGGGSTSRDPRGINIMVAGEDPWNTTYLSNLSGMFPGNLIYTEVPVENIGYEIARVWIRTVVTNESGGDNRYADIASSEPEYTDCGGFETGGYVERCNLSESIVYSITVTPNDVIINLSEGILLSEVNDTWIYLGQVSVGEIVNVKQSYFMIGDTSNWAQGDIMTFDLEFYAVSLDGVDP
jgi:hypothetical protein